MKTFFILLFFSSTISYGQDNSHGLVGSWQLMSETKEDLLRTHETNEFVLSSGTLDTGCVYQIEFFISKDELKLNTYHFCASDGASITSAITTGLIKVDGTKFTWTINEFDKETMSFNSLELRFEFVLEGENLKLVQI